MAKDDLGFQPWRKGRFRSPSESGDRMKVIFTAKREDDGTLSLHETGKEDLYEYIQSFAESCDINMIMRRYEQGDTDILQKVQGFYFDTTQVPDNMADLLNKLNYAESQFESMPASFKEKYGNDFGRFICTFDPGDFVSLVADDAPAQSEVKEVSDESQQQ